MVLAKTFSELHWSLTLFLPDNPPSLSPFMGGRPVSQSAASAYSLFHPLLSFLGVFSNNSLAQQTLCWYLLLRRLELTEVGYEKTDSKMMGFGAWLTHWLAVSRRTHPKWHLGSVTPWHKVVTQPLKILQEVTWGPAQR